MSFIDSIFAFFRFNKKNWKAVVLSILAATVFWCFNALNKNYSANISYPVEFQYDETRYIAVDPLPDNVRVNVNGQGWDLFRKSVKLKVPPLVIRLDKPAEVKKIVGSTLPALFSSQQESGMKINFILTDTLYINLDHKAARFIKIKADSVREFIDNGFGLTGPVVVSPDSVFIEGPQHLVNSIPKSISIKLPHSITEAFDEEVEVMTNYRHQLFVDPEAVRVRFGVDQMMELQETIPVNILNAPAKLSQGAMTSKVTIVYHLPASKVQDLPGDSLYAELDLRRLGKGTHKLLPRVVGLPKLAVLARVDSVQVSF